MAVAAQVLRDVAEVVSGFTAVQIGGHVFYAREEVENFAHERGIDLNGDA